VYPKAIPRAAEKNEAHASLSSLSLRGAHIDPRAEPLENGTTGDSHFPFKNDHFETIDM
jgi:hypothetical protein